MGADTRDQFMRAKKSLRGGEPAVMCRVRLAGRHCVVNSKNLQRPLTLRSDLEIIMAFPNRHSSRHLQLAKLPADPTYQASHTNHISLQCTV
jgi:hypothetical protein